MSNAVLEVNDDNFETEVLSYTGFVLVDFWASWCGPCKAIAPYIERLAVEMKNKLKVVKVNVDDSDKASIDHKIQSIPTIILVKDGKEVNRVIGSDFQRIKKMIEENVK